MPRGREAAVQNGSEAVSRVDTLWALLVRSSAVERLIWMTGTMCLIGENMSELKGERLELLRSVFMQYGGEVELIGPADNSSFVLAGRSGTDGVDTLVLVNLSDSTRAFSPVQLLERQYTLPPRSSLIIENTGNNRGRI